MKKIILLLLTSISVLQASAQTQALDNDQLLDLIQNQRFGDAAAYIRSFYPGIIVDQKIKSRLAYCNYMSGNYIEAEKVYLSILSTDSINRSALTYLATINDRRSNYQLAREFYIRVLKLDTTNVNTYKQLALNAENLLDSTALLRYLRKANKLSPLDPEVAYYFSKLLIENGELQLADSVISKAIEADPKNILLINSRMLLAHKQKNYKMSVAYTKQALDLGDVSAQTYNLYGIGNYYLKNYKASIGALKVLDMVGKSNETTFYFTALAYRQLDSLDKSNEYLTKSLTASISDNVPVYYQELSINNEMLKKFKTSISQLDRAETFEPKNVFNYSRGRIYDLNLNDSKNALKYYRRYIKGFSKEDNRESYDYALQRVRDLTAPTAK